MCWKIQPTSQLVTLQACDHPPWAPSAALMDSPPTLPGLHTYIHRAAALPARGLGSVHGCKVHNYFTVFKC